MGAEGKESVVRGGRELAKRELTGGGASRRGRRPGLLGIVIIDGPARAAHPKPRVTAFIWGGKVAPTPTLPFGRWKHVA